MLPANSSKTITDDDLQREGGADTVEVGQFYWSGTGDHRWLGCVMHIGSNYVLLEGPSNSHHEGHSCTERFHFDELFDHITREFDPDAAIAARVKDYQDKSNTALGNIRDLTARLGVAHQPALPGGNATGLAVLNKTLDIKHYQVELEQAKKTDLPALFKKVKESNEGMCKWLKAGSLPMMARANGMDDAISEIDGRILNISLYAGLMEGVAPCCAGKPAASGEKLHVMQRMLFMDEECLIGYRSGGMAFKDIGAFDDWVGQPVNRDRILPFQRCLVAMRVRRNIKDREHNGSFAGVMNNIRLSVSDRYTYLYIRNGEQVSRLSCEIDFDELIFPDRSVFDPSVEMMYKVDYRGEVGESMTKDCYDLEVLKNEADMPAWGDNWHPFNPASVYYDDILGKVSDTIRKYNRIAVIIQGLFDRSEVLHPHPQVKTWTHEGFTAAVELVYDSTRALLYGDAPDFESYMIRCNASMGIDSVVVGQERYWLVKEGEKENARLDRSWRSGQTNYRSSTFKPYGNDGPGYLSKIADWKPPSSRGAGKATFAWHRKRISREFFETSFILTKLTVPAGELFNVSAYTPGDYRQFFQDPRTRAQYLKWAPMLIAAEEYWAGNLSPQLPVD